MTMRSLAQLGGAIAQRTGIFGGGAAELLLKPAVSIPPGIGGSLAADRPSAFSHGCALYPDGTQGVSTGLYGQSCGLRIDTRAGIAVAVGLNAAAACYRDRVLRHLLKAFPPAGATTTTQDPVQGIELEALVGVYEGPLHRSMTVLSENDGLVLILGDEPDSGTAPPAPYCVLTRDPSGRLVPVFDLGEGTVGFFRDPVSSAWCLQLGGNAYKRREPPSSIASTPHAVAAARRRTLTVPSTVAAARLSTCSQCEKYGQKTGICAICHCFMRLKVYLGTAQCPLNKWSY